MQLNIRSVGQHTWPEVSICRKPYTVVVTMLTASLPKSGFDAQSAGAAIQSQLRLQIVDHRLVAEPRIDDGHAIHAAIGVDRRQAIDLHAVQDDGIHAGAADDVRPALLARQRAFQNLQIPLEASLSSGPPGV